MSTSEENVPAAPVEEKVEESTGETGELPIDVIPFDIFPETRGAVRFSSNALLRAPQLVVADGNTVTGEGGYRLALASRGVDRGSWYFEVEVQPTSRGHCRVGWGAVHACKQGPLGFDKYGYSMGDKDGTFFHASKKCGKGSSFGPGDCVGCLITLPECERPAADYVERVEVFKGRKCRLRYEKELNESIAGSRIVFFVNGVQQESAFSDIWDRHYFPAVSLYEDATVTVNFGPNFKFPPPGECSARCISSLHDPDKEAASQADDADTNDVAEAMAAAAAMEGLRGPKRLRTRHADGEVDLQLSEATAAPVR